jgi:hypothetical protein
MNPFLTNALDPRLWVLVFWLAGFSTAHAQYSAGAVSLVTAGNQAFVSKDYGSALLDYQAATYSDSTCGPAYQGIGNSLCQLGRYSGALSAYESALQLKPGDARLSKAIAQLNAKLGFATPTPASDSNVIPPPPPPLVSTSFSPSVPSAPATPVQSVVAPSPTVVTAVAPSGDSGRFALIPQGGGAVGIGNPFGVGLGGGIGVGYFLSDDFCLDTNFNGYLFKHLASLTSANTTGLANILETSFEATLGFKCRLAPGDIRPYVMAGGGISYLITSATASGTYLGTPFSVSNPALTVIAPLVQAGAGFEFMADSRSSFFTQIQCDMVFNNPGSSTATGPNVTTTLNTGGGVLVYVPIQVGFNFYL